MKKIFFALLLCSFIQVYSQKNIKIGLKSGANLSQVDIDQSFNDIVYQTKGGHFGFHAGAFFRLANNWIYVQPEMIFTSTGGKISVDSLEVNKIIELTYNKLDVPLNIGFKLGDKLRVYGGLVGSLLLKADAKNSLDDTYEDVRKNYTLASYGYNVGVGLDLNKRLSMDIAYEDNLSSFGVTIDGLNTDYRNNQLKFSVCFALVSR